MAELTDPRPILGLEKRHVLRTTENSSGLSIEERLAMIAATNFNGKKRNDVPDAEKTTDAQVASNIASIIAKVAKGKEEPKRRRRSQEKKIKFPSEEEEKATQAAVALNIASIMAKVASKGKNGYSVAQKTGTPTVTLFDLEAESEIPAKPSGDKDRRPPSVMILEDPRAPEVVILDDDDEILHQRQVLEPDVEEYHRDFEILDRDTVADTTRVPVIKAKDRLPPGLKGETVAKVGRSSHIVDIMKKATEILVSHLHDESTVVQEVSTLLTNLLGNRVQTWKELLVGGTVPAPSPPLPFTITRFFDMDAVAEPEPPTVTRKRVSEPEPEEPPSKRGRVEPESQELEDLMAKIGEDIEVIGCLIKGKWNVETSCPACYKQFNSKSELGTHIRKTHNDMESLKNSEIQKWFGMSTMCD